MNKKNFFILIGIILIETLWLAMTVKGVKSATFEEGIIYISNKTHSSFTLSWISHELCKVEVWYGLEAENLVNTAYDVRGKEIESQTHYVILKNLGSGQEYFYEVRENGVLKYQNQVSLYPNTMPPLAGMVYGQAKLDDGSWAQGAIIYLRIEDRDGKGSQGKSTLLSALVGETDGWWGPIGLEKGQRRKWYRLF